MGLTVQQFSIEYFLLDKWIPALMTVVIAAVLGSFFFPRVQAHYAADRAFAERRLQIVSDVVICFQRYIISWRRLLDLDDDLERMLELAAARNSCRDKLLEHLCLAGLNFSDKARELIDEYVAWDEAQSKKTASELPSLEVWRKWSARIGARLNKEVKPNQRVLLRSFWRSLLPRVLRRKKRSRTARNALS